MKEDIKPINSLSDSPCVFAPPYAQLNFDNACLDVPVTKYESRKKDTDQNTIANIVGGKYDNNMRSENRYRGRWSGL